MIMPTALGPLAGNATERMALILAMMREMSSLSDPQEMSRAYHKRMQKLLPVDRVVSVSRRDLQHPYYRVTRNTDWPVPINPWKEKHRLPIHQGGLLAELIYTDEPRLFDDLHLDVQDPAWSYLAGMRSVMAVPMFSRGAALNMVLLMRREPDAFSAEQFPEVVWMSNLFGQATHNLVLSEQLKTAYGALDAELKAVAELQRSLLPARMPSLPTMTLAADYQPSGLAGGDYYDLLALPDGKWGILIADVSGHGSPAAVLMAVLHSLVHTYAGPPTHPAQLFGHVNRYLTSLYTSHANHFVTAFYGVYDPATRRMIYTSAGHPPPRLKRCQDGTLGLLDEGRGLPLGVSPAKDYVEGSYQFVPGDQLVLYTDGIVEAVNYQDEMFGLERLDKVLANCSIGVSDLLRSVLAAVEEFTERRPPQDDRTVLVAKIS
jgi:phosphoserine phosphatase RsbU/P